MTADGAHADGRSTIVTLCVLLWEQPGRAADLIAYEDAVLPLLADHGGRVLQRVRRAGALDSPDDPDAPLEVHVLELPSETALDAYLADPRRSALSGDRDRAIARTDVHRMQRIADR